MHTFDSCRNTQINLKILYKIYKTKRRENPKNKASKPERNNVVFLFFSYLSFFHFFKYILNTNKFCIIVYNTINIISGKQEINLQFFCVFFSIYLFCWNVQIVFYVFLNEDYFQKKHDPPSLMRCAF